MVEIVSIRVCRWNSAYTFWLNFFAMLPMAKILGDITEECSDCALHSV